MTSGRLHQGVRLLIELERLLLGYERLPASSLVESGDWSADARDHYCSRCGRTVRPVRGVCCDGVGSPHHGHVVRLGAYVEPLAGWIRMVKYDDWRDMGRRLGHELGGVLLSDRVLRKRRPDLVVPVPMPLSRRFGTGIDHARVIAKAVSLRTGWPLRQPLRQIRGPRQSTASASGRRTRVDPFRRARWASPDAVNGLDVLLVDDVMTTGRTIRSVSRLLRKLGARSVTVAVLAVSESSPVKV